MDKYVKKIMESSKQIMLSHKEQATMRAALVNFVDSFPEQAVASNSFITLLLRPALALAVILLFLCGSISFAAQRSLPGDLLYPIKIHFNEQVGVWLAFSPQAKVAKRLEYSQTRLQEAERLAAAGKLSASQAKEININFESQILNVQQDIKQLQVTKYFNEATEASLALESSLNAHQAILVSLEQNKQAAPQLRSLEQRVQVHLSEAQQTRQENEHKPAGGDDAKMQERAKQNFEQAKQDLATIDTLLKQQPASARLTEEIRTRAQESQRMFDQGSQEFSQGKFSEAYIHFQQVHALSQGIQVLLSAQAQLKLDEQLPSVTPFSETPSQPVQRHDDATTSSRHQVEQHASSTSILNIQL